MFIRGRVNNDVMVSIDDESVKILNVEFDNYKKNQILNKDVYVLEICEKFLIEESLDEEVNGGQIILFIMCRCILFLCSIFREKLVIYDNSLRCNVMICNDQKFSYICRFKRLFL